jgi:hypothetical protein
MSLHPRTAALTISGTLLLSALTPGNSVTPAWKLLHGLTGMSSALRLTSAEAAEPLGPEHPNIPVVVPAALVAPVAPVLAAAAPGPKCDTTQHRAGTAPYQGASVSSLYDRVFRPTGPTVPYLDGYVPQGLTTWTNWDGAGHDLILLGMYRLGHKSYLVGINPATGAAVGTVAIAPSHLGGIGVIGDWLFAQDDNPNPVLKAHPMVRHYRLDALRASMAHSVKDGTKPYLAADGTPDHIDAIDYLTVADGSVWAGNHAWQQAGRLTRYDVTPNGHLRKIAGPWPTPPQVQGLVVTPDDFIFTSDSGSVSRGELTVLRRATPDQVREPVACIFTPSMPENLTTYRGKVFAVYESGTARYERDKPTNKITHLHSGLLDSLLSIADPVALAAQSLLGQTGAIPAAPAPTPAAPAPAAPAPAAPAPAAPAPAAPTPAAPAAPAPAAPRQLLPLPPLPLLGSLTNSAPVAPTSASPTGPVSAAAPDVTPAAGDVLPAAVRISDAWVSFLLQTLPSPAARLSDAANLAATTSQATNPN